MPLSMKQQLLVVTVAIGVVAGLIVGLGAGGAMAALVCLLLVAVAVKAENSIVVLALLSPFYNIAVFQLSSVDIRPLEILWFVCAVGIMVKVLLRRRVELRCPPPAITILLVANVTWLAIASLLSMVGPHSFVDTVQYGYLSIILWLVAARVGASTSEDLSRWARLAIWIALFFVLYSVVSYALPSVALPVVRHDTAGYIVSSDAAHKVQELASTDRSITRLSSFGLGSVATATVGLVVALVSLGTMLLTRPSRFRPFLVLLVALSSAVLLLTFSRAGWVVLFLGILVILAKTGLRRAWPAAVVIGALFAVLLLLPSFVGRLSEIGNSDEGSFATHLRMWLTSVHMISAKPLFGWGPGAFKILGNNLQVASNIGLSFQGIDGHNFVLQYGAEAGLVGVILISALVLMIVCRRQPNGNTDRFYFIAWLSAVSVLVMNLTLNLFATELQWSLLGLVLGLWIMAKRGAESTDNRVRAKWVTDTRPEGCYEPFGEPVVPCAPFASAKTKMPSSETR